MARPGSGLFEVPLWGCEPVTLESESLPRCPPGPVTRLCSRLFRVRVTGCVLALAIAVAAAGLGSCSRACTVVGAVSRVSFDVTAVSAGAAKAPWAVRACVKSTCADRTLSTLSQPHDIGVSGPAVAGPAPVEVTLSVRGADGSQVFAASGTAVLEEYQPSGPGCEPTVWIGQMVASGSSTLESR
jgi:hypothetical protein